MSCVIVYLSACPSLCPSVSLSVPLADPLSFPPSVRLLPSLSMSVRMYCGLTSRCYWRVLVVPLGRRSIRAASKQGYRAAGLHRTLNTAFVARVPPDPGQRSKVVVWRQVIKESMRLPTPPSHTSNISEM